MPAPKAVHRAVRVGRLAAEARLPICLSLAPRDPEGLQNYADRVSAPRSPDYRRFLTPAEVGRRFGPSEARVAAIVAYLKGQGLNVELTAQNRLSVLANGTVAQLERAFDTRIARFRQMPRSVGDRVDFFSYVDPPRLPAAFASSVVDISGLENATKPVPYLLNAAQARSIYRTAPFYQRGFTGAGRTIAISNYRGYDLKLNLPPFYRDAGLPIPPKGVGSNVTEVLCDTWDVSKVRPVSAESELDIQMVLGVAPLCDLRIYNSPDPIRVLTCESQENRADIVSDSWGFELVPSRAASAHNLHLSMTIQGITCVGASGDNGTDLGPKWGDYPHYEPEVLQVGGTVATVDALGNRIREVGWPLSGGGYSPNAAAFNVLPSWQKGAGVPTSINRRLVPDVALNAAGPFDAPGSYRFYVGGLPYTTYMGTSGACPTFAGLLGIAEQKLDALGYFGAGKKRLGRIQDLIYAQNGRSDAWCDIVEGGPNGLMPNGAASTTRAGWDSVTGWGAINVEGFVAALATKPCYPSSVTVYAGQGAYRSGSAVSLATKDGNAYAVSSVNVPGLGATASVLANVALPPSTTPLTVNLVVNGPAGVPLQLYAYNYAIGQYEYLAGATLNGADMEFSTWLPSSAPYVPASRVVTIVARAAGGAVAPYVLRTDVLTIGAR